MDLERRWGLGFRRTGGHAYILMIPLPFSLSTDITINSPALALYEMASGNPFMKNLRCVYETSIYQIGMSLSKREIL